MRQEKVSFDFAAPLQGYQKILQHYCNCGRNANSDAHAELGSPNNR